MKILVLAVLLAATGDGFEPGGFAHPAASAARQGAEALIPLEGLDPVLLAEGKEVLAYRGRGPGGAFGEIVENFSDFRTVEGLSLPFKVTGTFDGAADPLLSYRIESLVINGDVPPALFERPKPSAAQQ